MTAAELAKELGIKESYLKTHWGKVCRVQEKMGIMIVKRGRGASAEYGIRDWEDTELRWEAKVK